MDKEKVIVDNLKYRIENNNAYLIGVDDKDKLSHSLVIPDHIIVEGGDIPVIGIDESVVESWHGFSRVISIIIPDSITSMGCGNFRELDSLQSIVIGNGVKELDYCLVYCESLCSIVCNENLKFLQNVDSGSIRDTKWYQLQPYGSVCLGATLIGYKLAPNEDLKQYKVPDNIRYIMHGALDDCKGLQSIDLNNVEVVKCSLPDNIASIIASGDRLQEVESFDNTIWYKNQSCGCINIGSLLYQYKKEDTITPHFIHISEQTRIINKQAFSLVYKDCDVYGKPIKEYDEDGKRIDRPCIVICNDELMSIGESAFEDSAVSEIILSKKIVEIKDRAFKDSSLCTINLPEGLHKLGKEAFAGCQLKNIVIPASLCEIQERAFYGNKQLSCVHFMEDISFEGLLHIGREAFAECQISNIFIPGTVGEIEDFAFYNNWSQKNISLSEGIKTIGADAFASEYGGGGLHILDIPSSVSDVDSNAFKRTYYEYGDDASEVETLIVGSDVLDRCWVSSIGRRLNTVILKAGVTTIPEYCFKNCDKLANIIFPSTLTTIKPYAFSNCESLDTLILPLHVEELWASSLPQNIKKVIVPKGKLLLKIGVYGQERYKYYMDNKVFVDKAGNAIALDLMIYELGEQTDQGVYYFEGKLYDIVICDDFKEPQIKEPDDSGEYESNRPSYSQHGGYNDYDDDTINSAFEGDPEATWNVD